MPMPARMAWSNFFSRLTHSHPGRVVWVVFNVAIALLLMELGIFQRAREDARRSIPIVAVAWIGALVADLVINKPLGLSPQGIEFKRAHLYDINPVGVGAMLISVDCVALIAYFGAVRPGRCRRWRPSSALVVAIAAAPIIAWATKGKYYLARKPRNAVGRS